jgi:hypothetical protein
VSSPRRGAAALLLVALGAGFAWSAARLLEGRLEEGDVYPASSSLKADPDGARALYEALRELRGAGVRRNFEPIARLEAGPDTTLLLLGTVPWSLEQASRREADRLDSAIRSGTRIVIALSPSQPFWRSPRPTATPKAERPEKKGAGPGARPRPARGREGDEDAEDVSLLKKWGFALESGDRFEQPVAARLAVTTETPGLPTAVLWHSGTGFTKLDPAWRTVYTLKSKPVLIERTLGKGSIILASDSSFAANAALRFARQPALLAWLVGDRPEIVFDETHLGMGQQEGIAALARRYRLEGLFFGLLVLAALFVWKNAVPFAPAPGPSSGQGIAVAGRRASEGLVSALRRHISPKDLSRICTEEWSKAFARGRPAAVRKLSRTAASEDPVAAYNRARRWTKEKGEP